MKDECCLLVSTEHYHLQHNNHLVTVLSALAQDEVFVDVTLTAQGHSVKAHKVTSTIFTGTEIGLAVVGKCNSREKKNELHKKNLFFLWYTLQSVLSAMSPYFKGVLQDNPCQHPIIIMPHDVKFEELVNIINYIYK